MYLDAARHNPRQLEDLLDILQEKELHLRTPLEELELLRELHAPTSEPGSSTNAPDARPWEGLHELAAYQGPLDRAMAAAVGDEMRRLDATTPDEGEMLVDLNTTMASRLPDDEDEDLLAVLPDYVSSDDE